MLARFLIRRTCWIINIQLPVDSTYCNILFVSICISLFHMKVDILFTNDDRLLIFMCQFLHNFVLIFKCWLIKEMVKKQTRWLTRTISGSQMKKNSDGQNLKKPSCMNSLFIRVNINGFPVICVWCRTPTIVIGPPVNYNIWPFSKTVFYIIRAPSLKRETQGIYMYRHFGLVNNKHCKRPC